MKTLFVRIAPKSGPEKFFRCGMEFSQAWQRVDVDAATAARLQAEQMLDVTEEQPEGYEAPADTEAQTSAEAETKAKAPATKKK